MTWKYTYLTLSAFLLTAAMSVAQPPSFSFQQTNFSTSGISVLQIEHFLTDAYGFDIKLDTFHQAENLTSSITTFQILAQNTPLFNGLVKVVKPHAGGASITWPKLPVRIERIQLEKGKNAQVPSVDSNYLSESLLSSEKQLFISGNSFQITWEINTLQNGKLMSYWIDENGKVLFDLNRTIYNKPDSLVYINIYRPDPITMAERDYGGELTDDNDQASERLIDLMELDTIRLRWSVNDGEWQLRSDYAEASDFYHPLNDASNPQIAPPAYLNPTVDSLQVNRSEPDFEYFHVFYHLHQAKNWLESLGFQNLMDYSIRYDAHARTGDQSSFAPVTSDPRLYFGVGGVDDAEDADVIVHEYGHAISFDAAPGTNLGGERASLDEGFCDYLALSYSRRISDYAREELFNWDGHNEFWLGRELTSTRTYPTDKENNIYLDGILWASALAEISDYIGLRTTDQLAINSVYEWYPNMLLTDAARLFLKSDSLLNGAENAEIASIIFCERGLLNGCEDTLVSELPITEPYLGNTYDFAFNNEPLYIYPNSTSILALEVFDIQGRQLFSKEWDNSDDFFYTFQGADLRQGTFILRLITNEGPFSFKIIRTWL